MTLPRCPSEQVSGPLLLAKTDTRSARAGTNLPLALSVAGLNHAMALLKPSPEPI